MLGKTPFKIKKENMMRSNKWTLLTMSDWNTRCGKVGISMSQKKKAPAFNWYNRRGNHTVLTPDERNHPSTWTNTENKAPIWHRQVRHRPCGWDGRHLPSTMLNIGNSNRPLARTTGTDLAPGQLAPTYHHDNRHRPKTGTIGDVLADGMHCENWHRP